MPLPPEPSFGGRSFYRLNPGCQSARLLVSLATSRHSAESTISAAIMADQVRRTPPSMMTSTPIMKLESSERRKRASFAISETVPIRLNSDWAAM
jgi:hypothetical protein